MSDEPVSDGSPDVEKRSRRIYSDEEKIIALLNLDANGGNITRTAHGLQIPYATLAGWVEERKAGRIRTGISIGSNEKRGNLSHKVESVIHSLVESMAAKIEKATLSQAAVAFGILTDKLRIMRQPAEDPGAELAQLLGLKRSQIPATLQLEPGEEIPEGLGAIIETQPAPDNPNSFEPQSDEPQPSTPLKTHAPDCLGYIDIRSNEFKDCTCGLILDPVEDEEESVN